MITVPKDCEQNVDPEHPILGELVDVAPVLLVPSTLNLATLAGAAGLRLNGTVTLDRVGANTVRMSVDVVAGGRSLSVGRVDMSSLLGGPVSGEIRLPGGSGDGDVFVIYVENGP